MPSPGRGAPVRLVNWNPPADCQRRRFRWAPHLQQATHSTDLCPIGCCLGRGTSRNKRSWNALCGCGWGREVPSSSLAASPPACCIFLGLDPRLFFSVPTTLQASLPSHSTFGSSHLSVPAAADGARPGALRGGGRAEGCWRRERPAQPRMPAPPLPLLAAGGARGAVPPLACTSSSV